MVSAMIWDSNNVLPESWGPEKALRNKLATMPRYSNTFEKAAIPMHVRNHWNLGILDKRTRTCTYYCTLRWPLQEPQLSKLKRICRLLLGGEECHIIYAPTNSFLTQDDGYNCGPMICMIVKRFFI